jgi:hypothetical protein
MSYNKVSDQWKMSADSVELVKEGQAILTLRFVDDAKFLFAALA